MFSKEYTINIYAPSVTILGENRYKDFEEKLQNKNENISFPPKNHWFLQSLTMAAYIPNFGRIMFLTPTLFNPNMFLDQNVSLWDFLVL